MLTKKSLFFLSVFYFSTLIWSASKPLDTFTWFLEVVPSLVGLVVLVCTYRKFPMTSLVYFLFVVHSLILFVGGHYTYAKVPLFDWIDHAFHLGRNHYDKLGHFAQGFIPAIIAREILLRTSPLKRGKWLFFITVSICLAISAFYELVEWWVAIGTGEGAEAFLGTQGYIWDTQSDMFLALVGAVVSLFTLSSLHDAALKKIMND
ncbi:MAG: DUF2238 domain-containing protein [Deltaproteobacteria bacterium]|nr:MAG: DUF2238 domain-containing protein [Deltaproteobacteria bacterium]